MSDVVNLAPLKHVTFRRIFDDFNSVVHRIDEKMVSRINSLDQIFRRPHIPVQCVNFSLELCAHAHLDCISCVQTSTVIVADSDREFFGFQVWIPVLSIPYRFYASLTIPIPHLR